MNIADSAQTILSIASYAGMGAFIDFYVGKSGQRKIRSTLETWWIKISYMQIKSFAKEEAELALRVFDRIFGSDFFSKRRVASSIIFGGVAFLFGVVIPMVVMSIGCPPIPSPMATDNERHYLFVLEYFQNYQHIAIDAPLYILIFALNISITRATINIAKRGLAQSALANIILMVGLIAIQAAVSVYASALIFNLSTHLLIFRQIYSNEGFQSALELTSRLLSDYMFVLRFRDVSSSVRLHEFLDMFPSYSCDGSMTVDLNLYRGGELLGLLPALLRLGIALAFIGSHVLAPLRRIILVSLDRIISSDKPVFTLSFGFFASLATLYDKVF